MFWVEESGADAPVCEKRKRRVGKRKIEFVGWGSRPLIEFLEAIGKDTREKHSRQEVAAFISKYINDKGLTSALKKKKVLCDERLFALFGKKTVPRIKVFDMLEEHFAENHDDSDDDLLDSSDEDCGGKSSVELKNIPKLKNIPTVQKKKALKTPTSCFAAVIPENIKLLYLKRSVIQELLKFPESFEFKIVGSFVRIKSDPNDIYQKNRFQLQQVTGIEKVSVAGGADTEIHLKVSHFFKDVPICMLSDDNFSEEEVEDVRDRIKAGSLSRLTVIELQLKSQVLHVDITKSWIAKEISLLEKKAEHANEKGWQREKFEYLERRKMLQKPSEQEKLLLKLPEVIAEELEPEVTVAAEIAEISAYSPKSILRGSSDVSSTDASGSGEVGTPPKVILIDSHAPKVQSGDAEGAVHVPLSVPKADIVEQGMMIPNASYEESNRELQGAGSEEKKPQPPSTSWLIFNPNVIRNSSSTEMQVVDSKEQNPQGKPEQQPTPAAVIELSDDSEDEKQGSISRNAGENPNDAVWHYMDPQGITQGPFPLCLLKRWSDANYFHSGFIVWKTGHNFSDGVVLHHLLQRTFPY